MTLMQKNVTGKSAIQSSTPILESINNHNIVAVKHYLLIAKTRVDWSKFPNLTIRISDLTWVWFFPGQLDFNH